ncbi:hypothetical protein EV383_4083 [Pseudonocardia sediminis]|uniref:site-specific DNA-methyltransferase (adenine-specific) n=1 Tax=Pseudonocardia sediminis TaxID=1397368 RepID=A0A4Q7V154_PSEST|nr:hypothetical protein EV383_4083 [Pseudonocardia sediminis]
MGFFGVIGSDEVMVAPPSHFARLGLVDDFTSGLVVGDGVRDWSIAVSDSVYFPYDSDRSLIAVGRLQGHYKRLWPFRSVLEGRATFGGATYREEGRPWFEWHQIPKDVGSSNLTLALAEVATHNHFVLDDAGLTFKQTAPVVKLRAGAVEDDALHLLAVLNSSVACFWLKQMCHNKGSAVDDEGARQSVVPWDDFYQFNSRKLAHFPVVTSSVRGRLIRYSRTLRDLAQERLSCDPKSVLADGIVDRPGLDAARARQARLCQRSVTMQEELDWLTYAEYGLISEAEALTLTSAAPEPLALGERAFEIVLARKVRSGDAEVVWFDRHRSSPITELPRHWSDAYRRVVEARIGVIESRPDIALLEGPEFKRRWMEDPWERRESESLRIQILDVVDGPDTWFVMRDGFKQPQPLTISQLSDRFSPDSDVHRLAMLYADDHLGRRDMTLAQVFEEVVGDAHIPYLAAMRYQEPGLAKREEWERMWAEQRAEDSGGRLTTLSPPEYKRADFRKNSYWSHRGKLDVPKERFISYPEASPDADPTLLLGWAGWDHKDQAQALVNLVNDRAAQAGWPTERVVPLLAGLAEVMPWVHQWHGEYDPEWDGNPAEEYQTFLDQQRAERQLTEQMLRDWRPAAPTRGRRPRSTS